MIGEANLLRFALNKHFKDVPKILETPETRDGDEHKKKLRKLGFWKIKEIFKKDLKGLTKYGLIMVLEEERGRKGSSS